MGRNHKPIALHEREGTYREDRHGGAMAAPPGVPAMPDWLRPVAAATWKHTVAMLAEVPGLLSELDSGALALYCDCWQQYHDAGELLKREGLVQSGERGGSKHPATTIQKQARDAILSIGAKFGLTPTSRSGLFPTGRTEEDELMELIR